MTTPTQGEHAQTEALRPKFGDLLRNTMASESNPRRDAYFIREVHRSGGGVNPGRWFEMTDGKGETWLSNPQNLVPAATPGERAQTALAHELFAAAQLAPGEGIEDAVSRIVAAFTAAPAHTVDGEFRQFTTPDDGLNTLLNETFNMARGPKHNNMDTAMAWEESLQAVLARLTPAQPAAPQGVAYADSREAQMVVLSRDKDGNPTIWCDPEIAPIVNALNAAGLKTVASCSGHGNAPSVISLADGRSVVIARDSIECEIMTRVRGLDVNGAQIPPKGYVFMPIIPTLEMLDALRANTTDRLDQRYSNLLAAASYGQAPAGATAARSDALCDSSYVAGAKAGFNLGVGHDYDALSRLVEGRHGYMQVLAATRPLPTTTAQAAPASTDPAYSEACSLATALFEKHYRQEPDYASGRVVWSLCDTTAGVISQIDNMVSGLARAPAAGAVAGPDEVMKLVDQLVQAETSKNRTHAKYMGIAMPDDVYDRFTFLRDECIPELRAKLRAMIATAHTPAAQADSVLEDAARWQELREQHEDDTAERCCVFAPNDMRECLVPVGSLPGELDAFIDAERAARKQGGA